jgi:hypothetical protein
VQNLFLADSTLPRGGGLYLITVKHNPGGSAIGNMTCSVIDIPEVAGSRVVVGGRVKAGIDARLATADPVVISHGELPWFSGEAANF